VVQPVQQILQQAPPVGTGGAERVAPGFRRLLESSAARAGSVAAVRTPLTSGEAASALTRAWTEITGEPPSAETTSLLTAQWAHETARGASMYNYNFGGIKGEGPSGLSVAQRTREGWGENERTIVDRFRAYESAEQGAVDYVALLARRFPQAVEAAKRGDAGGFVAALKARGYFTGDEGAYTRSVHRLASEFSGIDLPAQPARIGDRFGAAQARAVATGGDAAAALPELLELPADTPFVSALALADELSRAALRIAGENRERT
jgi:hypothetical protein